jgi:hypothetical protein
LGDGKLQYTDPYGTRNYIKIKPNVDNESIVYNDDDKLSSVFAPDNKTIYSYKDDNGKWYVYA